MQTVFLDDVYRIIKTIGIEQSADYISENIDNYNITAILDDIHRQNDMHIDVYDTTQRVNFYHLYTSREERDLSTDYMPHQLRNYYNDAKEKGGEKLFLEEYTSVKGGKKTPHMPQSEHLRVKNMTCVRILQDGDMELMVVLRWAITPSASTVATLRFILIIITILLALLSVTMSLIISWKFAKPLKDTNETAKRLAREDYSVSFESYGYREVEELNSTLNFAATELGVASKLRKELIANVSHDLRTPLTMIKGYAEVMRDIPGEMNEENLTAIVDESTRLSNLVSDLLDISKLQSGAMPIDKKIFSLTTCISDILSRFTSLSLQQGYSLSFESSEEVFVFADKARIEQVLYNLISNAVNYSGERKEVIVCEKLADGIVRVEVTDSGKGIEPEKLKNIWDRYYRADKNHQRAVVGTGLGLSIVKEILDLHGAHFGVFSKVGEGSTFWFELPVYNEN
ncbi:MAG: HAMP domain-containing histidine kinase [Clostridia bacterium]|nr:HAMP domain-containing histidine kinase [Clostridia bacterium]